MNAIIATANGTKTGVSIVSTMPTQKPSLKKKDKYQSQRDALDELKEFLTGRGLPDGMRCKMPKLSDEMAMTVIWFVQVHMGALPENIEMCQGCKILFDSDLTGYYIYDENYLRDDDYKPTKKRVPEKYHGHWCDNCVPVDFC